MLISSRKNTTRAFRLFDRKYKASDLDSVQNLKEEHQKVARVLQAAELQGILDIYLFVV